MKPGLPGLAIGAVVLVLAGLALLWFWPKPDVSAPQGSPRAVNTVSIPSPTLSEAPTSGGPAIRFDQPAVAVSQAAGEVRLTIIVDRPSNDAQRVSYRTSETNASSTVVEQAKGVVQFASGQSSAEIVIRLRRTPAITAKASFDVVLSDASAPLTTDRVRVTVLPN